MRHNSTVNTPAVKDQATTLDIYRLNARVGLTRAVRGLDYVRCIEFPMVYKALDIKPGMRHLDIGCRDSVFPLYIAREGGAEVHALDLDVTVGRQAELARRLGAGNGSLVPMRGDVRRLPYADGTFDRISLVSVIEHVPGDGDAQGMAELGRVLKPGGLLVLTVPFAFTEKDFFMDEKVYSQDYHGEPVFFQRHYDDPGVDRRLIGPSGLSVARRAYFGEPKVAFFNTFWVLPSAIKPVKTLYNWMGPWFANAFMDIFPAPDKLKLQHPPMVTANGIFLVLRKS
jgi:SAM-dependent methyltransferase